MTMRNAFANLATEAGQLSDKELQEGILLTLIAMLEKMPRLDGADRLVVAHAEGAFTTNINAGQAISVSNNSQIGGRDASVAMFALANMGALHIYNNIQVS